MCLSMYFTCWLFVPRAAGYCLLIFKHFKYFLLLLQLHILFQSFPTAAHLVSINLIKSLFKLHEFLHFFQVFCDFPLFHGCSAPSAKVFHDKHPALIITHVSVSVELGLKGRFFNLFFYKSSAWMSSKVKGYLCLEVQVLMG